MLYLQSRTINDTACLTTANHITFLFKPLQMPSEIQTELLSLLNALSEDRLSREGVKRLELLVISNREARQIYVQYMNLHGSLAWDAGLSAIFKKGALSGQKKSDPARRKSVAPATGTERWSVARVGSLAAFAAVFLFVSILWLTQKAAPSVVASAMDPLGNQTPMGAPLPVKGSMPVAPQEARGNITSASSPTPSDNTVQSLAQNSEEIPRVALNPSSEVVTTSNQSAVKTGAFERLSPAPILDFEIVSRINGLLEKQWEEAGVQPAPVANDSEWLRRVYLDLAGHIPDRASLDRFLNDNRSNKRRLVVESLFQTPDYARNFSTVWMNLLVGRANERPINREALAKFLRHQFHDNRPWTETVARLVAAEGDGNEVGEANFLLAHLNNQAVPATAVTTRIFLCRQVQCTQCHQHPDSKHGGSMSDFWELNSFFQQAAIVENSKYNPATGRDEVVSRSLVDKPVGGPTFYDDLSGLMRVAYPKFAGHEVDPDATINRRRELARLMTTVDQQELAAALVNRTWNHFFGQGLVNPIDDMGPHSPCANPELLKALADAVIASGFDVQRLNRWIVMSRAYQLSSQAAKTAPVEELTDDETPLFHRMNIKPLSAEQVFDSLLVATAADHVGASSWDQAEDQRQTWMKQFFTVTENEENCDASRFDGTFSQTLMMMNGDLVQTAVSNRPGTVLHEIMLAKTDDQERIRQLCRAALGRDPRRTELTAFQSAIKRHREGKKSDPNVFEDIFWSYLNSTEFAVNH